ncbi:MAG: glycosyltransferase [Candidatus Solibacter sp.]
MFEQANMSRIGVMQVIDALKIGGAERVAVDFANLLPRAHYAAYLCTTRTEGPFSQLLDGDVTRLMLQRTGRFDSAALRHLVRFIRQNDIRILHAHGSSLFFASLASMFPPYPRVIWHDHYGRHAYNDRPVWLYRAATRRVAGVITVNQPLADWSRQALRVPTHRVWYLPNPIRESRTQDLASGLPGEPGMRIVCLANIRPQKDHANLLVAMSLLTAKLPRAHLLLVGDTADPAYRDSILRQIPARGLEQNVTYLGPRNDVGAILRACDVGVLGSQSEGLPLALLEYGISGLATVATDVGQCAEVLDGGDGGLLVPPSAPEAMCEALHSLLVSEARRRRYANRLAEHVRAVHSSERVIARVCGVYERVLDCGRDQNS